MFALDLPPEWSPAATELEVLVDLMRRLCEMGVKVVACQKVGSGFASPPDALAFIPLNMVSPGLIMVRKVSSTLIMAFMVSLALIRSAAETLIDAWLAANDQQLLMGGLLYVLELLNCTLRTACEEMLGRLHRRDLIGQALSPSLPACQQFLSPLCVYGEAGEGCMQAAIQMLCGSHRQRA